MQQPSPKAKPPPRVGGASQTAVLLVGRGEAMGEAIAAALSRRGLFIETTDSMTAAEAVRAAAPDLIVLMGDAAHDAGRVVLERLSSTVVTSVVPAVLLTDEATVDAKLRAFRHGAAAVVEKSASVDAIAQQVADLAKEIPHKLGDVSGEVGEATLDELVAALSRELRSGVLSVRSSSPEAIRLVLGKGRRVAKVVDEFVARLKPLVVHAEPLHYEFDAHAGGAVHLLDDESDGPTVERDAIRGMRILLADDDSGRADSIAQALRGLGAMVLITDLAGRRLSGLRHLDPQVMVIGEHDVQGRGYELFRTLRRDPRLRWASLIVVGWHELWRAGEEPRLDRLLVALGNVTEHDRGLRQRIERSETFDTRLEITGPCRLLRAFAESGKTVRGTVWNPRATISVDVGEHLIVGARAELRDEPPRVVEGPSALAALLVIGSGRVHIEPCERPEMTNLMATSDVALNLASSETPPLMPSLPPTRMIAEVATSNEGAPRAYESVPAPRERADEKRSWSDSPTYPRSAGVPSEFEAVESEANTLSRIKVASEAPDSDAPTLPPPPKSPTALLAAPPYSPGDAGERRAPVLETTTDGGTTIPAAPVTRPPRRRWLTTVLAAALSITAGAVGAIALLNMSENAAAPAPAAAGAERAARPAAAAKPVQNAPAAEARQTAAAASAQPMPHQRDELTAAEGNAVEAEDLVEMPEPKIMSHAELAIVRKAVRLGDAMLGGRKYARAISSYNEALAIDPRSGPAHMGLGLVAIDQNRSQDAVQHLRRAVSVYPRSAMFYYYLGKAYELGGDAERARSRYRYAVRLDPKNVQVRLSLGLPVKGEKTDEKARARAASMRPTGI